MNDNLTGQNYALLLRSSQCLIRTGTHYSVTVLKIVFRLFTTNNLDMPTLAANCNYHKYVMRHDLAHPGVRTTNRLVTGKNL